jgi:galactose mutarotase-like enzyme
VTTLHERNGGPTAVPLTGHQYHIGAGPYRATVTELGAGLRELLYDDQPLIAGYQPGELPPGGAGQLLTPWPNRIDGGRYTFGGVEHQLALTEPDRGNAIHGLTRWTAWTLVRHDAGAVLLRSAPHGQQGYPFCLEIDAEYRLDPVDGMHVAITVRNRGAYAAPYGTGSHPYLTAGTSVVDRCELTLPAASWLPTDDRGIPCGSRFRSKGPHTTSARRAPSALPGSITRSPVWTVTAMVGPGHTWSPAAARNPGSGCGPARAIAGCRSSPATRWARTCAAGRWPSSP